MRGLKRFLPLLTAAVLLLNVGVASALADGSVEDGEDFDWWNRRMVNGTAAIECGGTIYGYSERTNNWLCKKNKDGIHRNRTCGYDASQTNFNAGCWMVICDDCNHGFTVWPSDLNTARNLYGKKSVSEPARGNGYYTKVTNTIVDNVGNTTNYYRAGDTTNVSLVNTTNKTFSTINNNAYTTNNTEYNSYKANVDLSNFLNQYTYKNQTYNYDLTWNNYTYNTTNITENNYNYYTFYIDNSVTNNYDYNYDVNVTYAPQYTKVEYVSNSPDVQNVTNIYYYELFDGRNSYDLTADEIKGIATDYGFANYELMTEDPDTLALLHFDGDYNDSSAYNRTRYDGGMRSTTYVDTGVFGKAVKFDGAYKAGVKIPDLGSYDKVSIEFRLFLPPDNSNRNYGLYFGDNRFLCFYGDIAIYLSDYSYSCTDAQRKAWFKNWISVKLVYEKYSEDKDKLRLYINGDYVDYFPIQKLTAVSNYIYYYSDNVCLDEFRVTTGSLVSTSVYDAPTAPFDTNKVLARPAAPTDSTVYFRTTTPITAMRIGGVRPSAPTTGFAYIPLDSEYKGSGCQFYDGSNWQECEAYVYENETWTDVTGFRFFTVGDMDLAPDKPTDSDNPNKPTDPDNPDNPDTPDTPTKPTKPTDKTWFDKAWSSISSTFGELVSAETLTEVHDLLYGAADGTLEDFEAALNLASDLLKSALDVSKLDSFKQSMKDSYNSAVNAAKPPSSGDADTSSFWGKVNNGIKSLVSAFSKVKDDIISFGSGFVDLLKGLFGYILTDEILSILTLGAVLIVAAVVIKILAR